MIIDINADTLKLIQNPDFSEYARTYVQILADFMDHVTKTGIRLAPGNSSSDRSNRVIRLAGKGASVRSDGKSVYTNWISPACLACRKGINSQTFFISLKCHRNCYFCFNPNQEGYDFYLHQKRDVFRELEEIAGNGSTLDHVALSGGEPLLYKQDTLRFFRFVKELFPNAYARLYTCGDHADEETLQALKASGLDEIRFSLRVHDSDNAQKHALNRIGVAKKYIPFVMVEMPVLPDSGENMRGLLRELDRLEISGINLLEFCYPLNNASIYNQKGYRVKSPPFKILYDYWYAGALPIEGSERMSFDLLEFALDEGLTLGIHYCSLENKHTSQIFLQNSRERLPDTVYFSKKDFFLKSAKVFGEDISPVRRILRKRRRSKYTFNRLGKYLEFNVKDIQALKNLKVEIGIASSIIEKRGQGSVIRELKVDLTTPQQFELSIDV
jgi:pyruvate formate-lyase activating enzyme-like uncharacterized protein